MDEVFEVTATSPDGTDSGRQADDLAMRAAPVVKRVVASRLGAASADADDVCAGVVVDLLQHFRRRSAAANSPDAIDGIDAFENYVAQAAHHACDRYLRQRSPSRWRLRNRLRYLLDHDERLAVWSAPDGTWRCGLAAWRMRSDTGTLPSLGGETVGASRLRDLVIVILERAGGPLDLSALVGVCAAATGVSVDERTESSALDEIPDPRPSVEVTLGQLSHAGRVWSQILELPLGQRHALLLHLRDDAIRVLLVAGIASLQDIAAALEMKVETLASLWNRLPLRDAEIAGRLACTRQQVINLRMAARKRLTNRLAGDS